MSDEDPVAWLRAQVEARKAAAKLAAREGGTWTQDDPVRYPGSISSLGGQVVYDEGSPDEYQAQHIAANDPRDVIARCEAELAILDEHRAADGACPGEVCCITCGDYPQVEYPCRTVRLLAGGYRFRPGYREEWKP